MKRDTKITPPEPDIPTHCVVRHALAARESGEKTVVLFNLSGHGLFDLSAYDAYSSGKME